MFKKSSRRTKQPAHLNDSAIGDDMDHLALNAESFVENTPMTVQEAKKRSDSDM